MNEFQEVPPCGGKIKITIKSDPDGRRKYSLELTHNRPTPAAWFAVYALPQGIPVETIQLRGMGQEFNPPPYPDCFQVFIASDITGFFAYFCSDCQNPWRAKSAPDNWLSACPYCGIKGKPHQFLTQGQHHFIRECCEMFVQALNAENDGEYFIDLDEIADAVNKGGKKPQFFYVESTQQNNYKCDACGDLQDILGQFGYCSCCGTRNDFQEFQGKIIPPIRKRINNGGPYEGCVRDIVSAFDSYASKYVVQLAANINLTPARKNRTEKISFHNLESLRNELNEIFGIDIFEDLSLAEIEFASLMFHRRHVYEHGGGEADEKYIKESGDTTVKLKQSLRENQDSANRIANHVLKIAKNLHRGFHCIFPPEEKALAIGKLRNKT